MTLQAVHGATKPDIRLVDGPLSPAAGMPRADSSAATGGSTGCVPVRLLGGPYKRAQERAGRDLLDMATDRLLDAWQVGASTGSCSRRVSDYLSACSLMWTASGEPVYRRRAEHVVGRVAAWLRATGFDAVHALEPLRPGLLDARLHAGSPLAHQLLGLIGAAMTQPPQPTWASEPTVRRLDRVEHLLVNNVLASQQACGPQYDGAFTAPAATPLAAGTIDKGLDPAGVQDAARIGETIFGTGGKVLSVFQYVAAELSWREQGLRLSQVTSFPERPGVRLIFTAVRALDLTLRLRHPAWCRTLKLQVNGRPLIESHDAGDWLAIDRCWRNGDVVDLELPMHLHLAPLFPGAETVMLMFGPMALTRVADADESAAGESEPPPRPMPRLALRGRRLDEVVRRQGSTLRFRTELAGTAGGLELVPCHQALAGQGGLYFHLA